MKLSGDGGDGGLGPATTGYPESHLEEFFLLAAVKYFEELVRYTLQVPVWTDYGEFRLDARLTNGSRCVGLELDGKAFHDVDRDLLRDAAILSAGHVERIIRIQAKHVFRWREQTLWLVAYTEPWLFSPRARTVLDSQLRATGLRDPQPWDNGLIVALDIPEQASDEDGQESDQPDGDTICVTVHAPHTRAIREAQQLMADNPHLSLPGLVQLVKSR